MSELRRDPDKTLQQMQKVRAPLQVSEMRFHRTLNGGLDTGFVVVTYKVFPTDIINDFSDMKKRLESNLPEASSVQGYGEELVAYGLKALLVQVKFPEDKSGLVDEFESKLESMEGVSQVHTLMVRRTSR